jgi:hypothetical protein
MLAIALAAPRLASAPRESLRVAAELAAAFAILAPPFERALGADVFVHGSVFVAAVLAVSSLAIVLERRALLAFALAAGALADMRALAQPRSLVVPATLGGAGLTLLALGVPLRQRARLPWETLALDAVGATALFGAAFVRSWDPDGFVYGLELTVLALAVLAAAIVLHRRNLVGAAVLALGLVGLHALVDIVNRLPSYLVLALSGAALLSAGFVLLLKREAWLRWQRAAIDWWEGITRNDGPEAEGVASGPKD